MECKGNCLHCTDSCNTNQHGNSVLKEDKIIKALECCKSQECAECSRLCNEFPDSHECKVDLMEKIYSLINRQKAEIERVQQKNSELESDLILKTYDYEHLLMKCKELQAISSSRKDRLMQTVVKLQTAKSEAIKEFAERLKSIYTVHHSQNTVQHTRN